LHNKLGIKGKLPPNGAQSRGWHPGVTSAIPQQLTAGDNVGSVHILKQMFSYVWPKDRPNIRKRVMVSMGLLIIAKVFKHCFKLYLYDNVLYMNKQVVNVEVPFVFKHVVDYLNSHSGEVLTLTDPTSTVLTVAVALMIACE
jgi:ATP-binding cassette, subfamily B (MDR/TAP), member 7